MKIRLFPPRSWDFECEISEEEAGARTIEVFEEMEKLSKAHGFKVVVLGLNRTPSKQPFDLEKSLSDSLGFYFIDTAPFFAGHDYADLRIPFGRKVKRNQADRDPQFRYRQLQFRAGDQSVYGKGSEI